MEDLYRVFSRGVRFYLWRQLRPEDLDDAVHDTFLTVAQAIRRGELREPERLMGFVWTVVRRQVANRIENTAHFRQRCADLDPVARVCDRRADPERTAIREQHRQLAHTVLDQVSGRDREILIRFYLQEQTPKQICHAMELTETQFRLLKSRAKARFGQLGRRKLLPKRCW